MEKIYKRLFNSDGSLTTTLDAPQDGSNYFLKIEDYIKEVVNEAEENDIDLRDLQALIHLAVHTPISRAILRRKYKEERNDCRQR